MPPKPENVQGHRERLRNRILTGPYASVADYEILECLLGYAIPRRDVKPIAKELIRHFKSLGNVFAATPADLMEVTGIKEMTATLLHAVHYAHLHALEKEISGHSVIEKWDKILDYYFVNIGRETRETFHVLFLNAKACVISDEELQKGTVNQTAIYPREIIKRALALGAVYIVLIHNHPSGDLKPSPDDILMTEQLEQTCKGVNIKLHDHIIVSKKGVYSFKQQGCHPFR